MVKHAEKTVCSTQSCSSCKRESKHEIYRHYTLLSHRFKHLIISLLQLMAIVFQFRLLQNAHRHSNEHKNDNFMQLIRKLRHQHTYNFVNPWQIPFGSFHSNFDPRASAPLVSAQMILTFSWLFLIKSSDVAERYLARVTGPTRRFDSRLEPITAHRVAADS